MHSLSPFPSFTFPSTCEISLTSGPNGGRQNGLASGRRWQHSNRRQCPAVAEHPAWSLGPTYPKGDNWLGQFSSPELSSGHMATPELNSAYLRPEPLYFWHIKALKLLIVAHYHCTKKQKRSIALIRDCVEIMAIELGCNWLIVLCEVACSCVTRFWLSARTSFFIERTLGFSFVNTMAEANWRSGSAGHSVGFADRKPGPMSPFLLAGQILGSLG